MPLLGRHKSLPGSGANQSSGKSGGGGGGGSSPASTPTTTTTNTGQQQQQQRQPLVCESPLFGIRRQLPVAGVQPPAGDKSSRSATSSLSSSASLSSQLGGAGQSGATTSGQRQLQHQQSRDGQLGSTLSSIPKQISRQQIHYAFSMMDTDSDGLIGLRDLSQMLANLGVPIDEAILSHVMAPVSKRGDHLISEGEFLAWISNFIQVGQDESAPSSRHSATNRSPPPPPPSSSSSPPPSSPSPSSSSSSAAVAAAAATTTASKSPVSRSASASQSLAAQSPEAQFAINQQLRQRRGSGSGLALVRSLSSTSAAGESAACDDTGARLDYAPAPLGSSAATTTAATAAAAALKRERLLQEQAEARRDLKAAFCVFDLDGDGFITIDEVQQGLKLLGESWSQAELNQLFSQCGNSMNSSSSSSNNNNNNSKSKAKQQTTKQHRAELAANKQRISIDEFVQLLL